MLISYNEVLNAWKNFLQAGSGKLQFGEIMAKLYHMFSNHYHSVKYETESLIYMENLASIAYGFAYDIILKDDNRFKHEKGGDVQVEITVKMIDINTHKKSKMDAIEFIHKYCNPDCRAILEKGTIELL